MVDTEPTIVTPTPLDLMLRRPLWMYSAKCRGMAPELFTGTFSAAAKAVCARCPVMAECRQAGLDDPAATTGVWGGLTGRERQTERRRLAMRPRRPRRARASRTPTPERENKWSNPWGGWVG
jgi:WhiB family transcriptional regulator, redox-sensing transcriptional regulator